MNYHSGSKIKAVIFDMDGVLVNSEPTWYIAIKEFLARRGIVYTKDMEDKILGTSVLSSTELFQRELGVKGDLETLANERKELFYDIFMKHPTLMEGAEECIKHLHARGISLAVATGGHAQEKIKEILNVFHLTSYFTAFVSSEEVKRSKPAPDVYLFTAKKLGVEESSCLVLEDAPNGVMAGKAAGMIVYGVNKDVAMRKKLKDAGAGKVFSSLAEVAS